MPSTLLTPMVRSGATYSPFSTLLSSPTSTVLACPSSRRTVVHHARPPRRPTQPTHLTHLTVKPTAGTSRPNPAAQPSLAPSVTLPDSGLEFHHAPPPSAPSYATGNVPDVIKWLSGADGVRIDAQSDAPFVKGAEKWLAKNRASLEGIQGLSEDVVRQMNALREAEPRKWSRSALMKKFNVPRTLSSQIARLVPAPLERKVGLARALESKKQGWGWKKSVSREMREVRKGLW